MPSGRVYVKREENEEEEENSAGRQSQHDFLANTENCLMICQHFQRHITNK